MAFGGNCEVEALASYSWWTGTPRGAEALGTDLRGKRGAWGLDLRGAASGSLPPGCLI